MPIAIEAYLDSSGVKRGAAEVKSSLDSIKTGASSASSSFSALASSAKMFIGALAVSELSNFASMLTRTSDAIMSAKARIDVLSGSFEDVYQIAQRTGQQLDTVSTTYARVAMAAKDLGMAQSEVADITETLAKMLVVSGSTTQEASSAMLQFSQALASGRLQGDEFRSLTESLPMLMQYLSRELGVTRGELKALGAEGKITADVMRSALASAADEVDDQFQQMGDTFERSTNRLTNFISNTVASFMEAVGAADAYSRMVNALITALTQLGEGFRAIGVATQEAWGYVKAFAMSFVEAMNGVQNQLANLGRLLVAVFTLDVSGVKSALYSMQADYKRVISNIGGYFDDAREHGERLWQGFYKKGESANEKVQAAVKKTVAGVKKIGAASKDAAREMESLAKAFDRVINQTSLATVEGKLEKLIRKSQEWINVVQEAYEKGVISAKQYYEALGRIEDKYSELEDAVTKTNETAVKTTEKTTKTLCDLFKQPADCYTDLMMKAIGAVQDGFKGFLSWIKTFFVRRLAAFLGGGLRSFVGAIIPGLGAGGGAGGGVGGAGGGAGGGVGGAGGLLGIGSSLWSGLTKGFTGVGYDLMYAVPEFLETLGFSDAADYLMNTFSGPDLGGLTAGLGSFVMGLLSGKGLGQSLISGGLTGIGTRVGSAILPGIGTLLGALGGGLLGSVFGGLFGDNTERTYLTQAFPVGYTAEGGLQFGEPETLRWDKGKPDIMDEILEVQKQLLQGFSDTFNATADAMEQFIPGFKKTLEGEGWLNRNKPGSEPFVPYWSAEDEDDLQHDIDINVRRFGIEFMQPLVDTYKREFEKGMADTDFSYFTDEAAEKLQEKAKTAFDNVNFTDLMSPEDLEQQLKNLDKGMKQLESVKEITKYVSDLSMQFKVATGEIDPFNLALDQLNDKWSALAEGLTALGVDLEKMPEFTDAWVQALSNAKREMFGWLVELPEKVNETWASVAKGMSEYDFSGTMVQLLNDVMKGGTALEDVGEKWAAGITEGYKETIMSAYLDKAMQEITDAYMTPLMSKFLGADFTPETIQQAFEAMEGLAPALAQSGQSVADIFNYIQETGSLKGFDWEAWQEQYGSVWEEINQKNADLIKRQEDQVKGMIDAAKKLVESGRNLDESGQELKGAAASLTNAAGAMASAAASAAASASAASAVNTP